jgi:hypothetical protein
MITNSFSVSYRFRRSAALVLVTVCHFLIVEFFLHSVRQKNLTPPRLLMYIFPVMQNTNEKLKTSIEKVDKKIFRSYDESKNRMEKPIVVESKNTVESTNLEQTSTENTKAEADMISSKELASLDSLASRYNLKIPNEPLAETLALAQDARTNSARLTKSEKFAVAVGSLDCIFQTRLANGKVLRVPGHWAVVPARSEPGMKILVKSRFCVRFHQEAGEDGNDLMEIRAGIRGKL